MLEPMRTSGDRPGHRSAERVAPAVVGGRMGGLAAASPAARERMGRLLRLAPQGLARMATPDGFAFTVRLAGDALRSEGDSLRYAAIAALGAARLERGEQRRALGGRSPRDVALAAAWGAELSEDAGAAALGAWAAAEVANHHEWRLLSRLTSIVRSNAPLDTVACAWTLIAAIEARRFDEASDLARLSARRLMECQRAHGLFPHLTPLDANTGIRGGVCCFADQVYPIQALARYAVAYGEPSALEAAEACAARISALQGPAGQWWWHYDLHDGSVVERYPVYSVHQHAMAPMALMDLAEAGGTARWNEIVRGVAWLFKRPEVSDPLVDDELGVVWRKVGRREPAKAARSISAAAARLKTGLRVGGLDWIFPATRIDHECRPYELGWMLHAWLPAATSSEDSPEEGVA